MAARKLGFTGEIDSLLGLQQDDRPLSGITPLQPAATQVDDSTSTLGPQASSLPDSPDEVNAAAAAGAAALPSSSYHLTSTPSSTESASTPTTQQWEDDDLTAGSQSSNLALHIHPDDEGGVYMEVPVPPLRPRPLLQPSHTPEDMDSSPGSSKRARPTDSPAKGQRPAKIKAQQVEPETSDSSPETETVKKAQPPGPLKEIDVVAAQAVAVAAGEIIRLKEQIGNLQNMITMQDKIIIENAGKMEISIQDVNTRLRNLSTHTARLSNAVSTGVEEVERRIMDAVNAGTNRVDARITAAETRISFNEHKWLEMNNKFEQLMMKTEARLRNMMVAKEADGDRNTAIMGRTPDRDVAFQVSGILKLKNYLQAPEDTDPSDIIVELMELFDEYHAISRIILVDLKGKTRQTCDSVIVYMSSTYHKQKACAEFRKYLSHANMEGALRGVAIRDCFDMEEQPRARALNRYGGYLREEHKIDGYRVINRQGVAILQVYVGLENWTPCPVEDHELEPFFKTKEEREQQQDPQQQHQHQQQQSSTPAAPPAHAPQQQQRPRQQQQSRGRGSHKATAARGAARGAASGGAARATWSSNSHGSSFASNSNNLPVSQSWKQARQQKKEERSKNHEVQRQQKQQQHPSSPRGGGHSHEQQQLLQHMQQQTLQSAPLSDKEGEQKREKEKRDKEDLEHLKVLQEKMDTIQRAYEIRQGADSRKDSYDGDMSL